MNNGDLTGKADWEEMPPQNQFLGFNLDDLKMDQSFDQLAGVKKIITNIPIRKPARQWFVRVNPDPSFQLTVGALVLKEEQETYIVHPKLYPEFSGEFKGMKLFCAISKQGVFFIWPVNLPGADGKLNPWHESALEAVTRAQKDWIRVAPNMHLGAYDIFTPLGDLGKPEWPDLTMEQIINISFKHYIIDSPDHPVLKRLRGEI